jgi:glutamate-1-semialdehyde 2,1-aminomutase
MMRQLVEGGLMHGGTHNGNCVSVAGARATLAELRRGDGEIHRHNARLGERLIEGLRAFARESGMPLQVLGIAPLFQIVFAEGPPLTGLRDYMRRGRPDLRADFTSRMHARGVRLVGRVTFSAAHTRDDIDWVLNAAKECLHEMRWSPAK